jgi:anthranilate synthase
LEPVLRSHPHWESFEILNGILRGRLKPLPALFPEEERSKQPSAFSLLRALLAEFYDPLASRLALVGAFGYDLLFRFDPIRLKHPRSGVKDLRLFLCDDIYFMDRKKEHIERYRFDFTRGEDTTRGLPHAAQRLKQSRKKAAPGPVVSDHTPQEYAAKVETVREGMRLGNYYEVVLRQTFRAPYAGGAADLFERIQKASPSPYEFLLQFARRTT